MNLVPAKLRFKNFGVMKTLGQITSIVFDKAALIDESKSYVTSVKVDGTFIQGREEPNYAAPNAGDDQEELLE